MGLADLHIHSTYSYDGTGSVPAILKWVRERTQLDIIAITDHDEIQGSLLAQELAPDYGIQVIPGLEINSAEGHILGLFIQKVVPEGLSFEETILRVGDLGGLCVVAHPMSRGLPSADAITIIKALKNPAVARYLVGIETFNAGLVYSRRNPAAKALAEILNIARLGNSDAHILPMIGQGCTEFPGTTAEDLRNALLQRTTTVHSGKSLNGFHIISSWLPRYLLRKAGWVAWNSHPSAPIRFMRTNQIQFSSNQLHAG